MKTLNPKKPACLHCGMCTEINTTRIAVVLDGSGSMGSIKKETISGFNEQQQSITKNAAKGRKQGMTTYVSLYTFSDDTVETLFRDCKTLSPITDEEYTCSGMTPEYDAIGKAITDLEEADCGDSAMLVIIISDGYENSSKRWTSERLAEKIESLQATGRWTFTYMGANQDLSVVNKTLHIPVCNTVMFMADGQGTKSGFAGMSAGTDSYFQSRAAGQTSVDNFYDSNTSEEDED